MPAVSVADDLGALLATAGRLASAAGLAAPVGLERLSGGRNNRVFLATFADGALAVLKSYHADPRDPRDRLNSEYEFLLYAWTRGVRVVPRPLAREQATRSALYSFMPGRKLAAGEVGPRHLDAAAAFIRDLNAAPRHPLSLPAASESCFTLASHLATIERRVQRLSAIDPETPLRDGAMAFVSERLVPTWNAVKQRVVRDADDLGIIVDAEIARAELCISPSDFGFHNALCEDEARVGFIDFEYAGHDDPAKLVCDFFCQPDVPVPLDFFDGFVERVAAALDLADIHRARCRILLDAYRLKWICIILNDFLPADAARRAFADPEARAERCSIQLIKAAESMSRLQLH